MNETSHRASRSRARRWWVAFSLVLMVAAAGVGYRMFTNASTPEGSTQVQMSSVPVVLVPYQVTVAGPGTLQASTSLNLTVGAGLTGRISEIAEVGDRVVAGSALARLDPSGFERSLKLAEFALERAQAQLRSLESSQAQARSSASQQRAAAEDNVAATQRAAGERASELELTQRLQGLGAESDEALRSALSASSDAAKAAVDAAAELAALTSTQALQATARQDDLTSSQLSVSQAELDVEEAQAALASLTVTAPFAGVVSQVNVVVGAGVNDSTNLLTLIDDATLALVVQIDETQIGTVQNGQPATVTLDALPGRTFAGSVSSVSPTARLESNIAIFDVVVTLPNADLVLRPGMTAEAEIAVRSVPEALTLPSQAVTQGPRSSSVTVITSAGERVAREVEVVESVGFRSVVSGDFADAVQVVVPVSSGVTQSQTGGAGGQFNQGGGQFLPTGGGASFGVPGGGGRR